MRNTDLGADNANSFDKARWTAARDRGWPGIAAIPIWSDHQAPEMAASGRIEPTLNPQRVMHAERPRH